MVSWKAIVEIDSGGRAWPVSHLGQTACMDCGLPVMSTEECQLSARCIDCGRDAAGIDWAASDMIGKWHPTVGYPLGEQP